MFSTELIAAFLDLCSCYIFWLHLWVNKNVDDCLKYVYDMIISIDILLNRIIFWGICKYRIAGYKNRYRIESWRTIRFTPLVYIYISIRSSGNATHNESLFQSPVIKWDPVSSACGEQTALERDRKWPLSLIKLLPVYRSIGRAKITRAGVLRLVRTL